jgi:hypothetical protein
MIDRIPDELLEPPLLESINQTLDPDGRRVHGFISEQFTVVQIGQFKTVFELRHRLADEIERLMAILDALDPDPDLEVNAGNYDSDPRLDDAEGDDCDVEPSLASGSMQVDQSQEHWGEGECHWYADGEPDDSDFEESEQSPLG